MSLIPNKLQKQVINHKCKGAHFFRRFTKKNKTFKTDRYYCKVCGFSVLLENSYGHQTICHGCGDVFSMWDLKVYPKCPACRHNKTFSQRHPTELSDWMDDKATHAEVKEIKSKEDIINELMEEIDKKKF